MPEMDGFQLCQRVKEDPSTSAIPIMMVSAVRKEEAARFEGFVAGAEDYLEIPFRSEELLIKVARLIERHRAERALLKSEEEYRLLFKANPCSMYVCDRETLRFLAVNDAALNHYGYSREEFLSMTARDIRREEDVAAFLDHMNRKSAGKEDTAISIHRRKDGTLIDVEIICHEISFGNRLAYLILANDVTEKKKSEIALRESEHRYREIFDNANDIIYTHDLNGNFTSLNHTGEKLTGYSKSEVIGMNFSQVTVPEQLNVAFEMLARKLNDHEAATVYELDILSKQGKRLTLELSSRLIFRNGQPFGV